MNQRLIFILIQNYFDCHGAITDTDYEMIKNIFPPVKSANAPWEKIVGIDIQQMKALGKLNITMNKIYKALETLMFARYNNLDLMQKEQLRSFFQCNMYNFKLIEEQEFLKSVFAPLLKFKFKSVDNLPMNADVVIYKDEIRVKTDIDAKTIQEKYYTNFPIVHAVTTVCDYANSTYLDSLDRFLLTFVAKKYKTLSRLRIFNPSLAKRTLATAIASNISFKQMVEAEEFYYPEFEIDMSNKESIEYGETDDIAIIINKRWGDILLLDRVNYTKLSQKNAFDNIMVYGLQEQKQPEYITTPDSRVPVYVLLTGDSTSMSLNGNVNDLTSTNFN